MRRHTSGKAAIGRLERHKPVSHQVRGGYPQRRQGLRTEEQKKESARQNDARGLNGDRDLKKDSHSVIRAHGEFLFRCSGRCRDVPEDVLFSLFSANSGALTIFLLAVTISLGLGFGQIRVCRVSLGVSGVLFSGLLLAGLGVELNASLLGFVRDFGLVMFIFAIGLQVGPGFSDSLRRGGFLLNALAAGIVAVGFVLACAFVGLTGQSPAGIIGIFSGGTTSTPALAAASQTLEELAPAASLPAISEDLGLGYAIAYPFGIIGVIAAMLIVRTAGRIRIPDELRELERRQPHTHTRMHTRNLQLANANLDGSLLGDIPGLDVMGVTISRVMEGDKVLPAVPSLRLKMGMVLHAVGETSQLDRAELIIGPQVATTLKASDGRLEVRSLLVTSNKSIGATLRSLQLLPEHGITVTRIRRSGMELPPRPDMPLHYGDKLVCVGPHGVMDSAEHLLGNSVRQLNMPNVLPIFVGIALGVLVGSVPIVIPGVSSGVRLGLAGGPLLISILLSRVQHFAGLTWYLPTSAAVLLRETGICLFLSCVGLSAGKGFQAALFSSTGALWLFLGFCITLLPLLLGAWVARRFFRMDYITLCGLLVGCMTSAPTLAFAVNMLDNDTPSAVYATVYPFSTILRIAAAQALVLLFFA